MTESYCTVISAWEKSIYRYYGSLHDDMCTESSSTPYQAGRRQFNFSNVNHLIYWLLCGDEVKQDLAYTWADYYNIEDIFLTVDDKIYVKFYDNDTGYYFTRSEFEALQLKRRPDLE